MGEWKKCTIGDIIKLQRGHDLPKTKMVPGNIPVAGSNGVIGSHNEFTTKAPGITLGRSGNIGNPKFYSQDFWAHNTVLYVKDFKGNNEKFVFYFLNNIDFSGLNSGSAVPTLNRNYVHETNIIAPPLEEQKAIAEVLSSLDDKIDLLHRQNKTLEELAQTLFRQWFINNHEKKDLIQLGELVDVVDNRGKTPPFQDEKTQYPIIEVKSLTNNNRIINYDVCKKFVTEKTYNTWFRAGHPKENDILFSTVGSIGEISMFLGDVGTIAQNVVSLRAKDISPFYLFEFLNLREINLEIKELDIGSVQPSIKIPHLLQTLIVKPDLELMQKFDDFVIPKIEKIKANVKQIKTLENLRNILLPKLMSGEIRVKYGDSKNG